MKIVFLPGDYDAITENKNSSCGNAAGRPGTTVMAHCPALMVTLCRTHSTQLSTSLELRYRMYY